MRFFVTGATGFIGSRLVRRLIMDGHEVVALARNPDAAQSLEEIGAAIVAGDVTERDVMLGPMSGCDGAFHAAGWYRIGARDTRAAAPVNVEGTRNVLETMRAAGISKGVYVSTLAVFGDTHGRTVDEAYRHDGPWLTVYDESKWRAHYEVALPLIQAGLPLVVAQPGLNYGPGDTSSLRRTFLRYLDGKLPMLPQRTAFCWAHVDDTVDGLVRAMEHGIAGESYILAGPSHTLIGAFELAERITDVPAPRWHPAPSTVLAMSQFMGAVERVARVPEVYSSESMRVLAGVTYLGTSAKAERVLGFKARPLDEGLSETLHYEQTLRRIIRS
jgi:nucleoside-diphosphate-sugar epimerase